MSGYRRVIEDLLTLYGRPLDPVEVWRDPETGRLLYRLTLLPPYILELPYEKFLSKPECRDALHSTLVKCRERMESSAWHESEGLPHDENEPEGVDAHAKAILSGVLGNLDTELQSNLGSNHKAIFDMAVRLQS